MPLPRPQRLGRRRGRGKNKLLNAKEQQQEDEVSPEVSPEKDVLEKGGTEGLSDESSRDEAANEGTSHLGDASGRDAEEQQETGEISSRIHIMKNGMAAITFGDSSDVDVGVGELLSYDKSFCNPGFVWTREVIWKGGKEIIVNLRKVKLSKTQFNSEQGQRESNEEKDEEALGGTPKVRNLRKSKNKDTSSGQSSATEGRVTQNSLGELTDPVPRQGQGLTQICKKDGKISGRPKRNQNERGGCDGSPAPVHEMIGTDNDPRATKPSHSSGRYFVTKVDAGSGSSSSGTANGSVSQKVCEPLLQQVPEFQHPRRSARLANRKTSGGSAAQGSSVKMKGSEKVIGHGDGLTSVENPLHEKPKLDDIISDLLTKIFQIETRLRQPLRNKSECTAHCSPMEKFSRLVGELVDAKNLRDSLMEEREKVFQNLQDVIAGIYAQIQAGILVGNSPATETVNAAGCSGGN